MISYEGIFFENDVVDFIHSIEKNKLPLVNDEIHCTFKYHPCEDEIFDEIVGQEFEILIIGYGSDGKNSGFEIELPLSLKKYYINYDEENPRVLKKPHITTSLSEGAKSVNTNNLDFKPLTKSIKVTGKFGYWIKTSNREYVSFDPYKQK